MNDMHLSKASSGRNTTPAYQQYGTELQHMWNATSMPDTTPLSSPHNPNANMFNNQRLPTQGKTSYLTMFLALNHSVK